MQMYNDSPFEYSYPYEMRSYFRVILTSPVALERRQIGPGGQAYANKRRSGHSFFLKLDAMFLLIFEFLFKKFFPVLFPFDVESKIKSGRVLKNLYLHVL